MVNKDYLINKIKILPVCYELEHFDGTSVFKFYLLTSFYRSIFVFKFKPFY